MKILTAIGDPYINSILANKEEVQLVGKDIQYQEGILEIMEEKEDIDIAIISNILPGEYDFKILIDKIKKLNENIDITIFLESKNEDLEKYLNSENI